MGAEPTATEGAGARAAFWISAAIGAGLVAFAVRGLLVEERAGAPSTLRWFVGSALVVDLVVVPVAAGVGWLAQRAVPRWAWPAVRAGLVASAVAIAFAAPLVLGLGGVPDNPTVRPRDADAGLAQVLVAVWAAATIWLVASWWRRRRDLGG